MVLGALHHLALVVSDRAQSEPFYDQVLGFLGYHQVESNEEFTLWWSAQAGGISITALPSGQHSEEGGQGAIATTKPWAAVDSGQGVDTNALEGASLSTTSTYDSASFSPFPEGTPVGSPEDRLRKSLGLYHVAFCAESQEQVDALYDLLLAMGANIVEAPAPYDHYAPGYYGVFFTDPDGIRMEVVHMPLQP
ncbi:MAG TPA: VOC family protein [Synechococcales cyanobacterium M55_K2018_004]|nr:VOC family protein [Synechococcales cyanobacterium M55_K2018_004]